MSDLYDDLAEHDPKALAERCRLAERSCVLTGWTAAPRGSQRADAAMHAWSEWANHVGEDFTGPSAHPELDGTEIARLAAARRLVRRTAEDGLRNVVAR
jgi:hypothetical protein